MSAPRLPMECVFEDMDLTTLVLVGLRDAYLEHRVMDSQTPHHGPSRPSPDYRVSQLRTILRQTLCAMAMCSRVCKLWTEASRSAFKEILGIVTREFAHMRVETLAWLRSEPEVYDGVSLVPHVSRNEAVRIMSNSLAGPAILEPLRVCFEVPVPMGRNGGVAPLGNIHNPIAPYYESFTHWSPVHLVRHARTAGHWLRGWTSELTWVDPPTHNPEALWLATNRGCAVCGKQCTLQGHRVDLIHSEHHNTDEFELAMSMGERSPGPSRNPWVGLNAYIEVPWDLPPVNKRLVDETPHHIVSCMATRILPYTHRAHMVTLLFHRMRRDTEPPTTSYKIRSRPPIGVDAHQYDQTECEIMLNNVLRGLDMKHGIHRRWSRATFIKQLFMRRLNAIHASGLYEYMLAKDLPQTFIDDVCHPREFKATLPLLPMHGQPERHCWCAVLNLSREQFQHLAWTAGVRLHPPVVPVQGAVDRWGRQTLRHMMAVLSEGLPRFDNSAFYRVSEIGLLGGGTMQLHCLSGTYTSRILNRIEHERFLDPPYETVPDAITENQLLLDTWPDFQVLLHEPSVDDCARIMNRQSHRDVTSDQMLKHFVRLDSVLGPAWRHATRFGLNPSGVVGVQSLLLIIFMRHIKRSPNLAPVPLLMRHGRIIPGAPRHPDTWLRWFLRALVKPEPRPAEFEEAQECDWEHIMEVELRNTFIIDADWEDKDEVDFHNVGVHLTFYVLTTKPGTLSPVHMRMSVGIRMSELEAIRVGIDNTRIELDEGERLGSREARSCRSIMMPKPKNLASWHQDARSTCQTLTYQVRRSIALSLDLLRRLLDAEWTPVTHVQGLEDVPKWAPHVWLEGWQALRSHCGPGCEWFASTASVLPFCTARGLSQCACSTRCGAPRYL